MVVPPAVRSEIVAHAQAELPNEACGIVLLLDGVATSYHPHENKAASPYRFYLEQDVALTYKEDEGYELAIVHSHISSPPRPSRTDVEIARIHWPNQPYLIYCVRTDELAAWTIADDQIAPLELG